MCRRRPDPVVLHRDLVWREPGAAVAAGVGQLPVAFLKPLVGCGLLKSLTWEMQATISFTSVTWF
jgi:hypothetical protein